MTLEELKQFKEGYLIKIVLNSATGNYSLKRFCKKNLIINSPYNSEVCYNMGGLYVTLDCLSMPTKRELMTYLNDLEEKYYKEVYRTLEQEKDM